MAEPSTRFRTIPNSTDTTAINLKSERLANISGQAIVSTGDGNEADFGTVDISGGAANSAVVHVLWDVTADGGNATVETFKFWNNLEGFDIAGSKCRYQAVGGIDNTSPVNNENYVLNAVVGSYTWGDSPTSEPGAINLWPTTPPSGTEDTSMALSTTSDDVIMWANYIAIAAGETPGTYKNEDAGFQLQFTLKYTYS